MEATLIDCMGSDDRVVDAARVSFSKLSSNYTKEQNEKLIKYLAKHGHWTPFGHPQITIREKVPIFVARQRFKHQIGFVYNEVSRRYVDDAPEFFTPKEWRGKPINAKQGSSDKVIDTLGSITVGNRVHTYSTSGLYESHLRRSLELYNQMIEYGVAPEQARMVLPQSMMTEYYCTGSLAAWARAYKLRSDSHSQKEIQDLAAMWDSILRPLFPVSWGALVD
jgi:thymidylate synthase (FAD)